MVTEELKGKMIENLQRQHRKRIVRGMFWFDLAFFMIDLAFFFYYYITGDNVNEVTPGNYLPRRVFLPCFINTIAFLLAFQYNYRSHSSDSLKNRMVSIMFVTQVGCMSVCHAVFTPIWLGPAIVALMTILFMDEKLDLWLLWYNYVLAIGSAVSIISEGDVDRSFYTQSLVVVLFIDTLMHFLGRILQRYHAMTYDAIEKAYQEEAIAKQERDEADRANEAKSSFLANMSHEIRTPINAVIGMNEMILRESSESAIRQYAYDARSSANTLLGIINDILDFSKIESGKMEIIPVEYELKHVVTELVNMIEKRVADKGLELQVEVCPELPSKLYGDDVRIKQIVTNLLTNAVKYTERGRVTLTVDGHMVQDQLQLYICVEDTGIGIKQEDLDKLFSAFERIEEKRNRNIEGTGLGMSITTLLLNMMGSSLEVFSVYGKGSSFSFVLEQQVVDNTPIGQLAQKEEEDASYQYKEAFTAPGARLLVVDDNKMNCKVFKALLKKTQVQVMECYSGAECLQLTEAYKYDLIFLDHMMPELDGVETFKLLRSDSANLNLDTPVVVLTANAMSGAKEQYMADGFDAFLAKPIVPDELEQMLIDMLPKELLVKQE